MSDLQNTPDNSIHVVIASDGYYFPYVYVCVKTLFENNSTERKIIVHYIEQDVKEECLSALKKLANQNRLVDVIKFAIPEEFNAILPAYGAASKTTYVKFWFASMFPKLERLLYLDPDIIVLDDITELYDTDFDGNLIAAVIENLPEYHRIASKMKASDTYINGGMVLCNLTEWRKFHLEEKALVRLKNTEHNLNYDQGILNELCNGEILVFPPKYAVLAEEFEFKNADKMKKRYGFKTFYSQNEIDEAIEHPVMVHFTGFLYGKPMSLKCDHPYAKYFREQLKDTQFEYHFTNEDLDTGRKIRRFFLRHLPYACYLMLEKLLDIRRKKHI